MSMIFKKTIAAAVSAALMPAAILPVMAAEPVVQGPESVQDWYDGGWKFIRDAQRLNPNMRKAKNVILFVGDGMGVSTLTAARILEGQLQSNPGEENRLSFERFPYLALSKTYSWDQQTSDSAPTMTAMVTGYKARESMLAVNHETARWECDASVIAAHSVPTLLEQAAARGKATGIVSTARITHATPAATYAHTAVRDWEHNGQVAGASCDGVASKVKDIALQLIEPSAGAVKGSLKVALGGGRDYFRSTAQVDPEYAGKLGKRTDGRDLTAEWLATRGANAKVVYDAAGFAAATPANTDYLLGLFERSHMKYEADRSNDGAGEPSLTDMTEKSLEILKKNRSGYFLMVEGGRIDHAHHAGNAQRALLDAIELSKAVKKAYEMTNPKDTLIIVTADHSHTFTIAGYPHRGNPILGLTAAVPNIDGQTPAPSLASDSLPYTTLGYANGPGASFGWINPANESATGARTVRDAAISQDDATDLNFLQEATVPLGSETHAGEDVAIYASGPMSHLIHGSMEQNWIYHVMRKAFNF